MIGLVDAWREPYQVVIEVENRECQMVGKLASLGFQHLKVVDVRSSSSGAVRHLMDVGEDQAQKFQMSLRLKGGGKASPLFGLKAKAAKSATLYSRMMLF